ncbi:MAG: hypothetical protein KDB79_03495, partial [Acidobacteria bacterium]|nr:hypothetical protein [Acidobacteriota bacterium]
MKISTLFGLSSLFLAFLLFQTQEVYSQTETAKSAGKIPFAKLLKENSYEIEITNGRLTGSGRDFLLKATEQTQFFAIGEPHNNGDVPKFTSALFGLLNRERGFNYLALEQDPIMAKTVSQTQNDDKQAFVVSTVRKYPNGFTFITNQELTMIAEAAKIANGKGNAIWGIDQVFGAIHGLEK